MIIFIDTLSEMPLFRHLNNVKINIEQIKIKSWSGNNVEVRCVGDMALFSAVVDFSGVFCCYGIVFGYYYGIEFGCYGTIKALITAIIASFSAVVGFYDIVALFYAVVESFWAGMASY